MRLRSKQKTRHLSAVRCMCMHATGEDARLLARRHVGARAPCGERTMSLCMILVVRTMGKDRTESPEFLHV